MKNKWILFLSLAFSLTAFSGDAFLRIQSDAANSGARISINGIFKGECPLDVAVESGKLEVVAIKTVDAEHVQRWSQVLTLGDDAVKRIQVQLSEPVLTAKAYKARQVATYEKNKAAAAAGDSAAMLILADLYEQGIGIDRNVKLAQQWREKAAATQETEKAQADLDAAKTGDISAMERITTRYEEGKGIEKNIDQAYLWRNKKLKALADQDEAQRRKKIKDDAERVRSSLEGDMCSVDYLGTTKYVLEDWFGWGYDSQPEAPVVITSIPTILAVEALDLITTPIRFTKKQLISKKLKAHAAAWANPESMMGKAQENTEHVEPDEVVK